MHKKQDAATWPAERVYHDRVEGKSSDKRASVGDEIVVLYRPRSDVPLLTEKLRGKSGGAAVSALRRGMRRCLDTSKLDHVSAAYEHIGNHLVSGDRLELVRRFEAGRLRPKDLVGDYWVAHSFRRDGSTWHYAYDV